LFTRISNRPKASSVLEKLFSTCSSFVTSGAASGIGLEIAREFAKEGAKVVISDLNEKAVHHPALFTRISNRPKASSVLEKLFSTCSSFVTSQTAEMGDWIFW
jgi:NAD(P)-dependent dehydrogenase (short-subunit alcohol dehydrogenase family)